MQFSSRLIAACGLVLACALPGLAAPGYADPQFAGIGSNESQVRRFANVRSPIVIAANDSAGPEAAPAEGISADEVFKRYEQGGPQVRPSTRSTQRTESEAAEVPFEAPGRGGNRLQRPDTTPNGEDRPEEGNDVGDPALDRTGLKLPSRAMGSDQESPVATPAPPGEPGPSFVAAPSGSGTRAPFNLGVNKSVIDGGAEAAEMNLQSGAQQGALDNRFPPLEANASGGALKGGAKNGVLSGGLTQAQLQRLANHDLVLIIDQSGSMMTADCPISGMGRVGGTVMTMLLGSAACVSRWQWCRDQTLSLAEHTRNVCTKGFSVVLFSGRYAVYPHVTLDQIPAIFTQAFPQGGTNLTDPLLITVNDYIARRHRGHVKPLAIAIITDGRPSNEDAVRRTIIETTLRMKDPREITITFFLIGNSAYNGQAFVSDMERNLTRYGAKFNVVRSVSFWNLMKVGLPRALADALE